MKNLKLRYILLFFYVIGLGSCATHKSHHTSVSEFNCTRDRIGSLVPGTPNIRVTTTYCNDYVFEQEAMSRAISMFVEEYSETFGMEEMHVWSLLRGLTIELSAIPRTVKNVYSVEGKFLSHDVPVTGLAVSPHLIWVEIKTSQVWSSSLAHELVHIIIWRTQKVHGDPDHEGQEYSGWSKEHTEFLQRFKLKLMDLEI